MKLKINILCVLILALMLMDIVMNFFCTTNHREITMNLDSFSFGSLLCLLFISLMALSAIVVCFVCFIKFVWNVNRDKVFTKKNISLLRKYGVCALLVGVYVICLSLAVNISNEEVLTDGIDAMGEGFFAKNGVPEAGSVRFYANSIQRTRATARAFAAGMFPMADIDVEQHTPLGTMDPVFNPQITRLSDRFITKAYAEIFAMGGPDGPLKAKYALLEKVLDIKSSPAAAHDTTAFGAFPSAVRFELNKEPIMTGGLKMACSASDALTLQYYEEPDAVKAGFGHKLTRDEWAGCAVRRPQRGRERSAPDAAGASGGTPDTRPEVHLPLRPRLQYRQRPCSARGRAV